MNTSLESPQNNWAPPTGAPLYNKLLDIPYPEGLSPERIDEMIARSGIAVDGFLKGVRDPYSNDYSSSITSTGGFAFTATEGPRIGQHEGKKPSVDVIEWAMSESCPEFVTVVRVPGSTQNKNLGVNNKSDEAPYVITYHVTNGHMRDLPTARDDTTSRERSDFSRSFRTGKPDDLFRVIMVMGETDALELLGAMEQDPTVIRTAAEAAVRVVPGQIEFDINQTFSPTEENPNPITTFERWRLANGGQDRLALQQMTYADRTLTVDSRSVLVGN